LRMTQSGRIEMSAFVRISLARVMQIALVTGDDKRSSE